MDEEATPHETQLGSLFPISSTSTAVVTAATPPQWLCSSSFTADLSIINAAVVTHTNHNHNHEDDDEARQETEVKPSYDYLNSSDSEKEERENKGKKKKKKRRKSERDNEPFDYSSRKSSVRAWENSDTKSLNSKNYYFDSRGDLDNLAFGCLYRMDIGRYKLHDTEFEFRGQSHFSYIGFLTRGETDVDGLDNKVKSNGRYWSAKNSILEKQRNFKRIRVFAPEKQVQVSFDDYIPFSNEDEDDSSHSEATVILESWEDEVLRKTKDFNKKTREQPHNVKAWLDFAEFQDKVASKQPQKGARLQTLEKKISILEKAVELNPEDEDVLISLLKTYHSRDSADVLIGRWEKVLMQNSGSCKLWREFLRVVQGDFSSFKVSELRRMYAHAIQALYAALSKRHRQVHPSVGPNSAENVDADLEKGIIDIFLSLCRFEWQAGYHELATALLQAQTEYALFSPPLQLTEQSKKRLFEHFWNSNGARIGEDGALGWCTWLEKEEENRQKLMQEMSVKEEEQGGWTGWFIPPSKKEENLPNIEGDVSNVVVEEVDEQDDVNVKQEEEDDVTLMKMLGIDVDADVSKEVHDVNTWVRWSEEESLRDRDRWMPVRIDSGVSHSKEAIDEEQEQLSSVILFEDVNDFLFSLSSHDARLYLVMQFFDFFGGEISQWFCTNSSFWNEKLLSLETLPPSIIRYLESSNAKLIESGSITDGFEFLIPCSKNVNRTEIMKFLRNAALLCLKVFPRNYNIEEAILFAEEQAFEGINTVQRTNAPSQALAKTLLKSDRQDVLLCGVYARREAAYGNIGHARKVFDLALTSISGLPLETQSIAAPLLYLWYSEMELGDSFTNESESTSRALHILSCLGNGLAYTPYKGRPSSTQLLRAHQGFKERIHSIKSSWVWARNVIDESSVALICSASLFEELTTGWVIGVEVIADALSLVLPESKSKSYEIEILLSFQLNMIQRYLQQAKFSKVLQSVHTGLQIYPFNPDIFRCLVRLGHHFSVPSKLRLIFDELFQRKPSVIIWLFSLSYELSRGAPQHRIHGLFERALSNDRLHLSVLVWRCYISYEIYIHNFTSARRVFFRAIRACPWSKILWLDGFQKLNKIVTAKELMDLQKVMQDKELNLRTDIYEILLQDEFNEIS